MSKRGVCTDIACIYHSVADKFVTGLQISLYLTYTWEVMIVGKIHCKYYGCSPIIYRISCNSLGKGSISCINLYTEVALEWVGQQI